VLQHSDIVGFVSNTENNILKRALDKGIVGLHGRKGDLYRLLANEDMSHWVGTYGISKIGL